MAVGTTKIAPANPTDPDTAKSGLTNSEHHYQLLKGVAALEIADMAQVRSTVLPPIRAGPAKPPICYSIRRPHGLHLSAPRNCAAKSAPVG